jgi:hypothetical protein
LIIEGGPCVTQAVSAASAKASAQTGGSVAQGATQINITSSPSATSTATSAAPAEKKDGGAEGGAKCDKSDDAAPFGINVSTQIMADPDQTFQTVINLSAFSDDKHTLKINSKGLLDTSQSTSESQIPAALTELAQLAGMLSGGGDLNAALVMSNKIESEKSPDAIVFDPKLHRFGSFKLICPMGTAGQHTECIASVPVLGKTIRTTTSVAPSAKAVGLPSGKSFTESVSEISCDLDETPAEAGKFVCRTTTTLKTATVKDGTDEVVRQYLETEKRTVAKPPQTPAFARFELPLPTPGCAQTSSCGNAENESEGLRFRALTSVMGRLEISFESPQVRDVEARMATIRSAIARASTGGRGLDDLSNEASVLEEQSLGLNEDLEEFAATSQESQTMLDDLNTKADFLFKLSDDFNSALLNAGGPTDTQKKIDDFQKALRKFDGRHTTEFLTGPVFSIVTPVSVIDPTRTYTVTPLRRGLVKTSTTLDFEDGLLMAYDAEYPGPGGVLVGLPGDLISAFFDGLKDVFTLRIENIESQTGLVNANTGLVEANAAYVEATTASGSSGGGDGE